MLPVFFYLLYVMIHSARLNKWVSRLNMIGAIIVFSGVILDYLKGSGVITIRYEMTMPAVALYLLLQLIAIAKDFAEGRMELIRLNQSLDEEVALQTKQLKEKNEQLEALVWQDGLTGIANRRYFNEMVANQFDHAKQQQQKWSLIMIDIDEFKQYNDYYGHVAGYQLLKIFVDIINEILPPNVLFARYGGEEFVLITQDDQAMSLAEELRQRIEHANLEHLGRDLKRVTASFGVVTYTNEETVEELLHKADENLYMAKRSGRNRVYAS